ncbi:MAG: hypothetical protein H6814_05465 [Phycisphaeraceae bacterium]|nr:hypothetical protein [Phycisphaeraceae bacterium]
MSQRELSRPRNIGLGATAAPLLIVGALVLLNEIAEPSPSSADVTAPADPAELIRLENGTLTQAQIAAMRYSDSIPGLGESDSPFPPADLMREPVISDQGRVENIPDLAPPEFQVSTIMATGSGNIALINGKAHRVGDALEGGWKITSIDAKAKQVVLEHAGAEPLTISLNR